MVKHIVCFKLKDASPAGQQAAKDVLLSMRGKVEQIEDIQVGMDFLHSDRSYDVILEVIVKDRAALDAYQAHPYHVNEVKPYMHRVRSGSVSVDYEMD